MPHPHAAAVKASSRGKFKSITGLNGRGQTFPTESQDKRHPASGQFANMGRATQSLVKIAGNPSNHRLDKRARGGGIKKAEGGSVDDAYSKPGQKAPKGPLDLDSINGPKVVGSKWDERPSSLGRAKGYGYARGGKVKGKHGNHVNVAVVVPGARSSPSLPGPGPAGAAPPVAAPAPPRPPMPPQMSATGSPMPPPGIPMRKSGGKVVKKARGGGIDHGHKYLKMKAGAASGEGRLEEAHFYKRKGKSR